MELNELWKAALGEIELQVSKANFKTWLQNTTIADKKGGVVTIAVPNGFTKEWLQNKYHKFILRSLRNLESDVKEVIYQISSQNQNKEPVKDKGVRCTSSISIPGRFCVLLPLDDKIGVSKKIYDFRERKRFSN